MPSSLFWWIFYGRRNDVLLLVRIIAGDDCDSGFRLAQIHWLMWYVCRDEDKVSGRIHHALFEPFAVARLHSTLHEIDSGFIPLVNVPLSRAAG